MKKLTVLFSFMLLLMLSAIGVGCSDNEPVPEPSAPVATLELDKHALSIEVYASATLKATLANSQEELVWTSSDSDVARVANGIVTGYKVGTATITVSAGELSDSCALSVVAGAESPVFTAIPETLDIIKGNSEELDVVMTYKGAEFSFAEIRFFTEGDYLSVSEDGVITGLSYGSQTVEVKAFVGEDEIASKSVEVSVIEYGIIIVDLPENVLRITVGEGGFNLLNITVYVNGVIVENPEIIVESEDETVAKVENGKIVAVDRGETTVKIYYQAELNVYETTISVVSEKPVTEKDTNFFVKGNGALTSSQTGIANINLDGFDIDLSTVESVACNGESIAFTVDGNILALENAPAGDQVYTLITPAMDYVINGCVYTNTVSTKEEFLAWRENAGNIYAYTVLTDDIDLEGEILATITSYSFLRSCLDGRGHTVSNFTLETSLVPNVYSTGGFKNIQFVNAVQKCSGVVTAMKFGFLTQMAYGYFENILIIGRLDGLGKDVAHWGVLCYGESEAATFKNIIVKLASDSEKLHLVVGPNKQGVPKAIDNIYFIFDGMADITDTSVLSYTNSKVYVDEATAVNADWSLFEEVGFWTVEQGKIPYMSDYSNALVNADITVTGVASIGGKITFGTTSFYPLTYSLKEEVEGVSLTDNTLNIGNDVKEGCEITVVVSCDKIADFNREFNFITTKAKTETGLKLLVKGNGAITQTNTGESVIAGSAFADSDIDLSEITEILVNGESFTGYEIDGDTLAFSNAPAGDNVYTFVTPDADYTVNICVYVTGISTKEEFLAYRTHGANWSYTVLLNDIDMEGEVLDATAAFIRGTFDGRGHTISNFTIKKSLFGNIYANTGAVKNLSLVNVTQDLSEATTNVNYGFIAQTCQAAITIENVYIQGKITGLNSSYRVWAVLVNTFGDNSVIRNVILNIESECTSYHTIVNMAAIPSGATVSGVYVVFKNSSGAWADVNNNIGFVTGVYATEEALAAVDFSGWGSPWIVEDGKIPYLGV